VSAVYLYILFFTHGKRGPHQLPTLLQVTFQQYQLLNGVPVKDVHSKNTIANSA